MVYYLKEGFVIRDVGHVRGVVDVANLPVQIHDSVERHAPQFEEVDLLTIQPGNRMSGVGQSDIRQVFVSPVASKRVGGVGADGENFRAALCKFGMAVLHARQLRAAVRSHKAAQKSQHNRSASAKAGKSYRVAIEIVQFKIGRKFAGSNKFAFHFNKRFALFQIISNIFAVNFPVEVFCWLGW